MIIGLIGWLHGPAALFVGEANLICESNHTAAY